ncbi:MAG: PrsW family glutamic-type intramembrane protease [Bacteroidales bacterium]
MIKSLLFISIAPIITIALYIYIRDKYEKEPLGSLLLALLTGALIIIPAVLIESLLESFATPSHIIIKSFYMGFGVASLTEEGLKFIAFMLFFWRSKNFNEKFDGIVYAVFISLGFAAVENLFYVYKGGYNVGEIRAISAVPAHALFGIIMGYHLAKAKFYPGRRGLHLLLAFLMPFAWHGLYDFLLLGENEVFLFIFIPVFIYFWITGFRRMKELSDASVFRNDLPPGQ